MTIIDKTDGLRPRKGQYYSFRVTKEDGNVIDRYFKKKNPFIRHLKGIGAKEVIIDLA